MNCYRDSGTSKSNIVFEALGEALRYAMVFELPDLLEKKSKDGGMHFYACLSYLYLNAYIKTKTVVDIDKKLMINLVTEEIIEKAVEIVSQRIFSELLERFQFDTLDEIVMQLNEIMIPTWYFDQGRWLVNRAGSNPFLFEDYLYFIAYDDGQEMFSKIRTWNIMPGMNIDSSDEKQVLGYGYSNILGFDSKINRVYLGKNNLEDFYYYYDMLNDTYVLCKSKFLALKEGIPFVITGDRYFAYVAGGVEHRIKEFHEYEEYIERKDCFLVRPKDNCRFFVPYCVTFEGTIVPADIKDCKQVIWERIKEVAVNEEWLFSFCRKIASECNIKVPDILSIQCIMERLLNNIPSSERCSNKRFVLLENIFEILKHYVDENEDIMELLYVLCDASMQMETREYGFPSEELYWRLKELDVIGDGKRELELAIKSKNYEKVLALIVKGKKQSEVLESTGRIGFFRKGTDKLDTSVVELVDGIIIGNQVISKENLLQCNGIVVFDFATHRYNVISDFYISPKDRLQIMKDYNLQEYNVSFTVQL